MTKCYVIFKTGMYKPEFVTLDKKYAEVYCEDDDYFYTEIDFIEKIYS